MLVTTRRYSQKVPFFGNFNGNFDANAARRGSGLMTGRNYALGGAATLARSLTSIIGSAFHNLNKKAAMEDARLSGRDLRSESNSSASSSAANSSSSLFGLNSTPEAQRANKTTIETLRNLLNPYTGLSAKRDEYKKSEEFMQHRVHPFFKVGSQSAIDNKYNNTANTHNNNNDTKGGSSSDNFFGGGSFSSGGISFGGGNMGGGGGPGGFNPFGGGGGGGGGSGGGGGGGNLFDKMLEWCSVSHAKDIAKRMGIDLRDIKFNFGANGECTVKVDAPNATPQQIKMLGEAVQQECPVARFRKTTVKSNQQEMKWELLQ